MTRAIVCGGRDYANAAVVKEALDYFHKHEITGPLTTILEGGARGADALAREWARENNVPLETHNADWARYGRAAGPRRNALMVAAGARVCIAFPGGEGTADMREKCRLKGIDVIDVYDYSVPRPAYLKEPT